MSRIAFVYASVFSFKSMAGVVPPDNFEFNDSIQLSEHRQFAWLSRSKTWSGLDPTLWQARKVLGTGATGVVGKWDYIGIDPTMPRHMVIKQCNAANFEHMKMESKLLELLSSTGSGHVIRLYRAAHRDAGTGTIKQLLNTGADVDPLPITNGRYDSGLEVGRMYLEFADGKDLGAYMEKKYSGGVPPAVVPEEHVWRVLGCLIKAIHACKYGTEDPDQRNPRWKRKIVHFDIKPHNILIALRDASEHRRLEKLKLADFGLALFVPDDSVFSNAAANEEWLRQAEWRATPTFVSPEQYFWKRTTTPGGVNRAIDDRANIWMVGAIIYTFVTGSPPPIQQSFEVDLPLGNGTKSVRIIGSPKKLLETIVFPYSQHLMDIILGCLAFDPRERPHFSDTLIKINHVLRMYDNETANDPVDPNSFTTSPTLPNIMPNPTGTVDLGPFNSPFKRPDPLNIPMIYTTQDVLRPIISQHVKSSPSDPSLPLLLFPRYGPAPNRAMPYQYDLLPDTPMFTPTEHFTPDITGNVVPQSSFRTFVNLYIADPVRSTILNGMDTFSAMPPILEVGFELNLFWNIFKYAFLLFFSVIVVLVTPRNYAHQGLLGLVFLFGVVYVLQEMGWIEEPEYERHRRVGR